MNACKAIERALQDTLKQFEAAGADTFVWCVQNAQVDWDARTKLKDGRYFPQIRLEATPEHAADNAWTFEHPVSLTIATNAPDDPWASQRGDIYESVRTLVTALYFQLLDNGNTFAHAELDYLTSQFSGYLNGGTINLGGLTLPGNPAPGNVGEIQTMDIQLMFHWSQQYTPTTTPQG